MTRDEILEAIRPVQDPEIGISIVDLGLVYDAKYDAETRKVDVDLTLTSRMCPMGPQILAAAKAAAMTLPDVDDAEIHLVWTPRWDPKEHASEEAKAQLGIW